MHEWKLAQAKYWYHKNHIGKLSKEEIAEKAWIEATKPSKECYLCGKKEDECHKNELYTLCYGCANEMGDTERYQ